MPKNIVELPVEAGVYTEQTARGAVGRWKNSDKVRFRYGLPEKIGGWGQIVANVIGLARKMWDWSSLDTRVWVSIGTEAKLYLYQSAALSDITPLRRNVTRTNPIDTTISSDIVTITDASHGAQVGDYVNISGATPVGGITVDGEYQILTIPDIDSYTIQDDQTAGSSANGGGSVTFFYDISVGLSSTSFGTGWGTGTWSQETWSTPRTISTTVQLLRTWSLDNWGEDLIANPRGGSIYWWDRNTGSTARAVVLAGAPPRANFIIISQQDRHLFALGATDLFTGFFDPLLIRWCSKEDFNDWTPTSTNTAGDLRLFRGSQIVTGVRTRGQILVFTDVSVHQINFLGGSAVYGVTVAGENVSILGPNALVAVDYRVFFMAEADFYIYDGVLKVLPSDVRNRVYENLTISQKDKVFAGLNREFNEIWFFYPGKDENVWIEDDFSQGLLTNDYGVQTMSGAQRYTVAFNAGGYIEMNNGFATSEYDGIYSLLSGAEIVDATDVDYEVTFTLADTSTLQNVGLVCEVTDLTSTPDTAGDNIWALTLEVQVNNGAIYFRTRNAGSIIDMSNGGSPINLSTLPNPVTLAADTQYSMILSRSGNQITGYFDDPVNGTQQIATFALSAGEIVDFPGTVKKAGPLFAIKDLPATGASLMQALAFRVAPADVLVNSTGTRGATTEVNRYALYNYEEGTWAVGELARTAWADRSPAFNKPYAAGTDMVLYKHETGQDDDGAALPSFVETYDMEIPEAGEYLMHIDQLIPDFVELEGSVDLNLKAKKYPQIQTYTDKGPYTVTPLTTKNSVRIRGRQIAMRVSSDAIGDKWRMGTIRARIGPHGKRS